MFSLLLNHRLFGDANLVAAHRVLVDALVDDDDLVDVDISAREKVGILVRNSTASVGLQSSPINEKRVDESLTLKDVSDVVFRRHHFDEIPISCYVK